MTTSPAVILLATEDQDLGIVPASTARAEAQQQADELRATIWMRDPVTDEPLGHVEPGLDPETLADLHRHYAMRGD